jgi:hypothetical protein
LSLLHIVNGESTLRSLPVNALGGDAHSWWDMLMEGPPPDGTDAGWQRRAESLEARFGIPRQEYLAARDNGLECLTRASAYDETVLWFEGDLFCLANLTFLLDWFSAHPSPKLSLVCPSDERLGTLRPDQLAALFEERQPVTPSLLDAGRRAWRALAASTRFLAGSGHPAFCAATGAGSAEAIADAREVLHAAQDAAFMFGPALQLQLARIPDADGLSPLERQVLDLVTSEPIKAGQLFKAFCQTQLGIGMGLGDLQFAVILGDLAAGRRLAIEPIPGKPPHNGFGAWDVRRP